MVTVVPLGSGTVVDGTGIGIGEFFNPTPINRYDGQLSGTFPNPGVVGISEAATFWEFGFTIVDGDFLIVDNNPDLSNTPDRFTASGPNGGLLVTGLVESIVTTLTDGQTTALTLGVSNEEGFYRELFAGADDFTGSRLGDVLQSFDGADEIDAGRGADQIDAGAGRDTIKGGAGKDRIEAGDGADFVRGGNGSDLIFGDGGADSLDGGGSGDVLRGGQGNDNLTGGAGKDTLRGEAGADALEGGTGNDVLNGGAGPDDFIYRTRDNSALIDLGTDRILNFKPGKDRLDFRDTDIELADLTIGTYQNGTEITVATSSLDLVIRLPGVEVGDVMTDDFMFPGMS